MKFIAAIFLLSLLALSVRANVGDPCTEETCTSTVAVLQSFSGVDCSGTSDTTIFLDYTLACDHDTDKSSVKYTCSNTTGLVETRFTDTAGTCVAAASTPTSRTVIRVNQCINNVDGTSQAYWCNAAAANASTPTAARALDTSTPVAGNVPCTAASCQAKYGLAKVYFTTQCTGDATLEVPPSALSDTSFLAPLGQCTQNNITGLSSEPHYNAKVTCGQNEVTLSRYYGGACTGTPDQVISISRDKCVPIGSFFVSIACTPTNGSSINVVAPFLIVLALLSALLL